jgi:hypothetical protein
LPHLGLQSSSLFAFARSGQQPSLFAGPVIGLFVQSAVHWPALPSGISIVQAFLSSQELGQSEPSHFSFPSLRPFPHIALQSESLLAFAPSGQQPSPPAGLVIGVFEHSALHEPAFPISLSAVHGSLSSHEEGQSSPSQISLPSLTPLPHISVQSLSSLAFAPGGQHISPPSGCVIGVFVHSTLH